MDTVEYMVGPEKKIVLVDAVDVEVANFGKSLGVGKDNRVRLVFRVNGKIKTPLLHRLIVQAKPGQIVDHVNGNPLDNRKANLRFCTHSQNSFNRSALELTRRVQRGHPYKGIIKNGNKYLTRPWIALCQAHGKQYYSRYCGTPLEAAREYDKLAKIHHGEFARLNFPETA